MDQTKLLKSNRCAAVMRKWYFLNMRDLKSSPIASVSGFQIIANLAEKKNVESLTLKYVKVT